MPKKKQFYAVAIGRKVGIYQSWDDCKKQTEKYSGARYKAFSTEKEAKDFIASHKRPLDVDVAEDNSELASKRRRTDSDHRISIDISFDGGSRGNPGIAGAGAEVVLEFKPLGSSPTEKILHVRKFLGRGSTNNVAEYWGVIAALEAALPHVRSFTKEIRKGSCAATVRLRGDSQLVLEQLAGRYRCNDPKLVPLNRQVKTLLKEMNQQMVTMETSYKHVKREHNSKADALANEAMDMKKSWCSIVARAADDEHVLEKADV